MKNFSKFIFAIAAFAIAASASAAPSKRAVPSCTKVSVSSTITVAAGATFDGLSKYGKWVCLVGSGSKMDGSQSESQIPHFILGSGSTLKNIVLGDPNMGTGKTLKAGGADGVHCTASCTINNVYWGDVGEDAATMKGSGTMTVSGGAAYKGADKIFQNNGPGSTISISDFYAEEAGKLYRSCGNCSSQSARYVKVSGVTLYNVSGGVGVNSSFDSSKLPALKGAYDVATMSDFVSNKSSSRCVGYIGTSKGNEPSKDSNSSNIARSCKFQ